MTSLNLFFICIFTALLTVIFIFLFNFNGLILSRSIGFQRTHYFSVINIWIGICISCLFSEAINFIWKIDWLISLLFFIPSVLYGGIIFTKNTSEFKDELRSFLRLFDCIDCRILCALCIFILVYALGEPLHPDSGSYHFQSIRWINEAIIPPGLGNLHSRLAYNQSYFGLVSIINFFPLSNRGYVIINLIGLITFFMMFFEFRLPYSNGKAWLIACLTIPICYYGFFSLSSPSPEILINILQVTVFYLIFYIYINKVKDEAAYISCVLILCVFLYTVKLSGAVFAFFGYIIIFMYAIPRFKKNRNAFVIVIIINIITIMIHMARGYYLSGYPFYPSLVLGNIFPPEWIMSKSLISSDASWIRSWARMPTVSPEIVLSSYKWIIPWAVSSRFGLAVLGTSLVMMVVAIMRTRKFMPIRIWQSLTLFYAAILLSIFFWFYVAPDWRFLGSILYIYFGLTGWHLFNSFGPVFSFIGNRRYINIFLFAIIILCLINFAYRKHYGSLKEFYPAGRLPDISLGTQYTKNQNKIYIADAEKGCWDSRLPCTHVYDPSIEFRSLINDDYTKGFYMRSSNP